MHDVRFAFQSIFPLYSEGTRRKRREVATNALGKCSSRRLPALAAYFRTSRFMTFLNPFLLLGLVAAAIPIIIHLFNLRKLKTIEFSSLQFLKELQKTKMRRVKIRQILLLILRTLLIVLIVLAFARPALRGSMGTIGSHAKSSMVILLDDSPSMSVRDERGAIFTRATTAVDNLLNLVQEGDELYFIRLSEVRHKDVFTPTSAGAVREVIDKAAPSMETASFRDALGQIAKVLAGTKNFNQEVYLITDAQATQFVTAARDSADLFDDRVKFFIVETGRQQDNAGVTSLDVATQIISKNKPVSIKAIIRNFAGTPMNNSLMSVYVDGVRVVQQALDIAAQSTGAGDFSIIPKRRGILQGYVQIEDDALDADNKRFFAINVPENISVLLIGGKPQDTRLVSLALTLGGDSSLAGVFTTTQTTQPQLSSLDINKFDVLVFCGVKEFTPTDADRIAQFVKAGGGVAIFPDDESNIPNWNETVFSKLGIPACRPAEGEHVGSNPSGATGFLSFDRVDYDHPLFQGLFEQTSIGKSVTKSVESPRVFKAIKPHAGDRGRTIISLSDGSGFLTEYESGAGRVLLFSVEANLGWSDFPVKGVFAPLLHRSTVYLAQESRRTSTTTVGESIDVALRLKNAPAKNVYAFKSPGGIEERVIPHTSTLSGLSTFESSTASEVGVYQLRDGKDVLHAAAVNIDPAESDLKHATSEELVEFWNRVGVKESQTERLRASDKVEATVLESRLGVELWRYLLALAIVVALIEMAVAREGKSAGTVKGTP